jgi:hypothetical protein
MGIGLLWITFVVLFEAIALWSVNEKPWQFSLRALLIVLTVAALVMGLMAALAGSRDG